MRRFALGEEEALRASIAAAEARPPEDPSTWNDGLRRLPYFKLKIPRPRISRQCACCQKLEVSCAPTSARFRVCAACMRVAYCSKEVSRFAEDFLSTIESLHTAPLT